jgi:uncharacterized protein (DUF1501 family)
MNRRDFIKYASLTPLAGMIPSVLANNPHNAKILLLIELKGGNDGLNTLIPEHQQAYYDARPKLNLGLKNRNNKLRITNKLKLEKGFYLNPYLKELKYIWDKGDMAWIQGVGYPDANRSHFYSIDVWNTADPLVRTTNGWLTKKGLLPNQPNVLNGIVIGDDNMGPFAGKDGHAVAMQSAKTFLKQTKYLNRKHYKTPNDSLAHLLSTQNQINSAADLLQKKLHQAPKQNVRFPNSGFGRDLQQVSNLIISGVHLPVFKVTLPEFDTHAGQVDRQNNLLYHLGGGLRAFQKSMTAAGLWNNVLVMTYSEFGRRVAENSSLGTDHGSASAHFVLGGRVNKGIHGEEPSLEKLDNGDLIPTVDFRQMYATIAQRWWGRPNPWAKEGYKPLKFV